MASKRKILLWCEGETEMVYLRELMKLFPQFEVDIRKAPRNQPMAMIEDAGKMTWWSQYTKDNSYEQVFVFFDQDSHKTYDEAIEVAKNIPFLKVIWSNPCIEAWFLFHFRNGKTITDALKLTDKMVLSTEKTERQKKGSKNEYELITVETYRKIASPTDCIKLLQQAWPQYKKNDTAGYLKTLKSHLAEARARAKGYNDPKSIGTAFTEFLDFLSEESNELIQQKSTVICSAPDPSESLLVSQDDPSTVTDIPMIEASEFSPEQAVETQENSAEQAMKAFLMSVAPYVPEELSIQECWAAFKKFRQILDKFNFINPANREAAEYAILTAACMPWLDHIPLIVLNCKGKGRAKHYFAELLCAVACQKIPTARSLVNSAKKPKYFDNEPVLFYTAKDTVDAPQWLKQHLSAGSPKLITLEGNDLKTLKVRPFSIEVIFKTGGYDAKELEMLIAQHASDIRKVALILVYMRNRNGNSKLNRQSTDFQLWRCLCASSAKWLGNKDLSAVLRFPK